MPSSSTQIQRPLRRAEYDQLVGLGAFADEHIELLDGALVQMSPIGPPHCATVDRLTKLLVLSLADKALVRVQAPFAAGDLSEPEPDLALVPLADYDVAHPDYAYLIIEVAESSLSTDRGRKARLYAECQVPEYWVVNVAARQVEVHTEPAAGTYAQVEIYTQGMRILLRAFPEFALAVDDFLK
jgi:Uma2 family endonuclease